MIETRKSRSRDLGLHISPFVVKIKELAFWRDRNKEAVAYNYC